MSKKNSVLFTVKAEQGKRVFLKLRERADGDLILLRRGANFYRAQGSLMHDKVADPWHGKKIAEQHLSVHQSPKSADGTNVIKYSLKFEGGDLIPIYHFTLAVKQTNSFAFLYCTRCSEMKHPDYDFKQGSGQSVSFGRMEQLFQLVYAVFVAPKGRRFNLAEDVQVKYQFSYRQISLASFDLVFMWSFLGMPPTKGDGGDLQAATFEASGPSLGDDENGCLHIFNRCRHQLRLEYLAVFQRLMGEGNRYEVTAKASAYFRHGTESDAEYQAWKKGFRYE